MSTHLRRRGPHRRRRQAMPALSAACLSLLVIGGLIIARGATEIAADVMTERRYAEVSDRPAKEEATSSERASRLESEPNATAWLMVEGTPIDYPVAQAEDTDPEYYLSHDLWGNATRVGCPFLDSRCDASSRHKIIYAHHMGTTGLQFSPIADAWRQERFDALGVATLETAHDSETFRPLCALVVDKEFSPIQRFDMDGYELGPWLTQLVNQANARARDAEGLCQSARNALTLVTCASAKGGQRERTLLVFVEV